jgi:hypothetical protein
MHAVLASRELRVIRDSLEGVIDIVRLGVEHVGVCLVGGDGVEHRAYRYLNQL